MSRKHPNQRQSKRGARKASQENHRGDTPTDPPHTTIPNEPSSARRDQIPTNEQTQNSRDNAKFWIEVVGLLVLIAYTVFAGLQWGQAKWTNHLTREALNGNGAALAQTLKKMDWQAQETHEIAKQALAQALQTTKLASNTHDLATQAKVQSEATQTLSSHTESLAKTAEQ